MKFAGGFAAGVLLIVAALIFLRHDLRGWTPANYREPSSVVESTRPNARRFAVGECLPGTISPWNSPRSGEYSGNSTVTVLSCRSKSRAVWLLLAYLATVALAFATTRWMRKRRP